jgi:hypothetical protein
LVERSAALAEQWHAGQKHFFGGNDSYFNIHLVPVAKIVRRLGYGALYIAGAYLHDIREDTTITDERLVEEGIPDAVVHAVGLMTKKEGQSHDHYLAAILTSRIATVGKFADSSFNYAWTMLNSPAVSDEKFRARVGTYALNISILRPHLPDVDAVA